MSQPIMSGAAPSAQIEMWVYCSFGASRLPAKLFQIILPMQSMSGSFHSPGAESRQTFLSLLMESNMQSHLSITSPVTRQLWPPTFAPQVLTFDMPYWQRE